MGATSKAKPEASAPRAVDGAAPSPSSAHAGWIAAARLAVPAIVLAAIVLLPFLGKAFTIDDPFFLNQARHALTDPLHPSAFEMVWLDAPRRVSRWPQGPLMGWLLMPVVALGADERLAHLLALGFLAFGIVATVSLALRLGCPPPTARAAGLLLVAMPAVAAMAGTAMPDVPAMALGAGGIERLLAWRTERRAGAAVAASLLLGVAPLARPHAMLLWLVGGLLLLDPGREDGRRRWAEWIPLACAVALWALVSLVTRDPEPGGADIVTASVGYGTTSMIASNVVSFFVCWALAMAFAIQWAALRRKALVARWWVFAVGLAASALLQSTTRPIPPRWAFAPVAALSLAVLVDVLAEAVSRRAVPLLALGAWLVLPAAAALYVHFPAKYLVVSAPAAAILIVRAAEGASRAARLVTGAIAVAGIALGILILQADAAFAEVGRTAAAQLIAPRVREGRRVWFAGHWGFHWYAERAGATALDETSPVRPGDFVAVVRNGSAPDLSDSALRSLRLVASVADRGPGGRIMDWKAGAGFYSNLWGYLPWAWGNGIVDQVDLAIVHTLEPGPPAAEPPTAPVQP